MARWFGKWYRRATPLQAGQTSGRSGSSFADRRRRAAVLLMVVSMLALLIVIVTSFLSVTRASRDTINVITEASVPESVLQSTDAMFATFIGDAIKDGKGKVLGGGGINQSSFETIPGYRRNHFLASLEPVWDEGLGYFNLLSGAWIDGSPRVNLPDAGSWSTLAKMRWPSVTALEAPPVSGATPKGPLSFALCELMLEDDSDGDMTLNAAPAQGQVNDIVAYSINPFMDADGDGVPDAAFLLSGLSTQMANGAAGLSVSLPSYDRDSGAANFSPSGIPQSTSGNNGLVNGQGFYDELWERVSRDSRYFVAHRVVSHGGMININAPAVRDGITFLPPIQRNFVTRLFDSVRSGLDAQTLTGWSATPVNELYSQIDANSEAIEASLRRRFLLPSPLFPVNTQSAAQTYRRVPEVLSMLQGESTTGGAAFRNSLVPRFSTSLSAPYSSGRRVDLAAQADGYGNPRNGWAIAAARRPVEVYSPAAPVNDGYDRRHLVTTVSTSDELARKLNDAEPQVNAMANPAPHANPSALRTYRGELKFYLGEVNKAFDTDSPGIYRYNPARGNVIIARLARLFGDMLSEHGNDADWSSAFSSDDPDNQEAVSKRQQAFMLAVNTVAFAAPRDTLASSVEGVQSGPGWVDPVVYVDTLGNSDASDDVVYTGYAPQPFISEVQVHNDPSPFDDDNDGEYTWDPEQSQRIAVAIELFNPQDPYRVGNDDAHALYEDQFGIWIENGDADGDGESVTTSIIPLGDFLDNTATPLGPFPGRQFRTYVVNTSSSTFFNNVNGAAIAGISESFDDTESTITIKLMRQQKPNSGATPPILPGSWQVVDRFVIGLPAFAAEDFVTGDDPGAKSRSAARDASRVVEFAPTDVDSNGILEWARWGLSVAYTRVMDTHDINTLGNARYLRSDAPSGDNIYDPDDGAFNPGMVFSPRPALITMNAAPRSDLRLFDPSGSNPDNLDLRPRSFPTPGFMLFVPRFSHARHSNGASWPMSRVLERQRDARHSAASFPNFPADFGHMPTFDNDLDVESSSYMGRVGKIPWGLLVFDYVTTLNPQTPGVDPLRVSGRIDINTAPWTILANLPVIGPDGSDVLPLNNAAGNEPAPSTGFWDPYVGVMVGEGTDWLTGAPILRFYGHYPTDGNGRDLPWTNETTSAAPRWRLGPWLAHSAAAYRDGVQMLPLSASATMGYRVFADSQLRGGVGVVATNNGTSVTSSVSYRPVGVSAYGDIRGAATGGAAAAPTEFGFVSLGELLNVKGFDSTMPANLPPNAADASGTTLGRGDFVKAVSMMALLDTQWLTTRSNTFTVYTSIMDRERPEQSLRSQTTFDRSNLLPRLDYVSYVYNGSAYVASTDSAEPYAPLTLLSGTSWRVWRTDNDGETPQVISQRVSSYLNDRADD